MPTSAALELTFLGHQTWHISDGDAVVLLDPILTPAFGAGRLEFTIWPPRTVDTAAMPAPTAVILSHEHLDHFHLPSLDLLDRTVPLYTGTTPPPPRAARSSTPITPPWPRQPTTCNTCSGCMDPALGSNFGYRPTGPITRSRVGWIEPATGAERRGLAQLQAFLADPHPITPTSISQPIPRRWDQARD